MSKCYYCSGVGYCQQCRKKAAPVPSPNEVKAAVVAKQVRRANDFVKRITEAATASPKKKMYGWISQQSKSISRTIVYRRPDGSEVEVSFVSSDPTEHGTNWKDIKFLGEVTEYVRQG